MKKSVLLTLFTVFFFLPINLMAIATVGEAAAPFKAVDSNGKEHSLSDFLGKIVVLEWTNHDCPYVKKHYETNNMQSLQRKYTDQGIVWLTINSSAEGKQGYVSGNEANTLVEKQGSVATAYLLDPEGKIGKLYGAKTTPHMYVIDTQGKLAYAGAIDDNSSSRKSTVEGAENYVASALDALLTNTPIKVAGTDAYGCSVKYKS